MSSDSFAKAESHAEIILQAALIEYNSEAIRLLLGRSANVDGLIDHNERTSLHVAVERGQDTDVIRLLIERGADFAARDENGRTALVLAIEKNSNPGLINLLRERSAENGTGRTCQKIF